MDDIVKKLREYAGKVHHAPATEAMISAADHIDSLEERITENVKAPSDELTRYIARCREMSTSGLSKQEIKDGKTYSWWSRLAEILTALEAQIAERVKVKPLEWEHRTWAARQWAAPSVAGDYFAGERDGNFYWHRLLETGIQVASIDEAKAAAQADYERRILSALEATPPAPKVTDEVIIVWHGLQGAEWRFKDNRSPVSMTTPREYIPITAAQEAGE